MQLRKDLSRRRIAAHHWSLEPAFASITLRQLDTQLVARLHLRAARNGRSIEEEVLSILRSALSEESGGSLADAIRQRFAPLGSVDLPEMSRESTREPPDFDDDAGGRKR
ncbi:FitA-like ribbon-helix-helix domain-containing protein [Inquilinus sp.]|jgi:plasmid stability protein|uniref:FitA-like ribbon-helix-helix domain-containing protein n=1 Tax=Inquilinus sp. TaxID=1932117 RepID=UPI003784EE8E